MPVPNERVPGRPTTTLDARTRYTDDLSSYKKGLRDIRSLQSQIESITSIIINNISSPLSYRTVNGFANDTMTGSDDVIFVTMGSGQVTLNLPSGVSPIKPYYILRGGEETGSEGDCVLDAGSGNLINNSQTLTFNATYGGYILFPANAGSTEWVALCLTPIATIVAYGISTVITWADQDSLIIGNTDAGIVTLTLPSAEFMQGHHFRFKRIGAISNLIIAADGADTIDGGIAKTLTTNFETLHIVSNGDGWYIIP